jgi:hypothetical protein
MWLTYSMNKEDIWISRVPLPIRHDVDKWVNDSFDGMKTGGIVTDWNIYSLKWAPVEAVEFPSAADKSLKLSDREPYDYARAVRVFPAGKKVKVKFDMLTKQTTAEWRLIFSAKTGDVLSALCLAKQAGLR